MKKILLAVLISFSINIIHAQDSTQAPKPTRNYKLKDHLVFGGGLTAQFGNVIAVGASPTIGYKFNNKWMAGIGADYLYYSFNDVDYHTSIYGGNIFTRYKVLNNLFLHGEYGFTNWEVPVYDLVKKYYSYQRRNVPSLYVGAGYSQPISDNASFNIMALYDLLHTSYSFNPYPYTFRVGINVGF